MKEKEFKIKLNPAILYFETKYLENNCEHHKNFQ